MMGGSPIHGFVAERVMPRLLIKQEAAALNNALEKPKRAGRGDGERSR